MSDHVSSLKKTEVARSCSGVMRVSVFARRVLDNSNTICLGRRRQSRLIAPKSAWIGLWQIKLGPPFDGDGGWDNAAVYTVWRAAQLRV